MEGGSSAVGSRGAGGDLCTAQEPREEEVEEAGAARGGAGGAMRARVCARVRTPQGVGALLLLGGAIVGGAVVAWRRRASRHGDGKGAKNHHRERPAYVSKEKVLDGGVVEDEQGGASARKFDQSDGNLSGDNTEVGANGSYGKATEELGQIPKDDEIVEDLLDSKPAETEKVDQNSSRNLADSSMSDMDSGIVEKVDKNSTKSDVENEVTPNDTQSVENSDQSTLSVISPEVAQEEHNNHDDDAHTQETESTETTPTAQMMTRQEQLSEEVKTDTVTETAEAKLAEGTIMEKNVFEQEEAKALAELVDLVGSPAYSPLPSLLKPTEKKGPANPGWNETGMKLEQDVNNGELKEHELSKGGATQGGVLVPMDHRTVSMAILALMFAVTIGVTIVMRLYAPLQAT